MTSRQSTDRSTLGSTPRPRRDVTRSATPVLSEGAKERRGGSASDCSRSVRHVRKLLKNLKRRSSQKKRIFTKEWGYSSFGRIRSKLCSRRELEEIDRFKYRLNPNKYRESSHKSSRSTDTSHSHSEQQLEVYKSSDIFLKGTQSANPHNDYSQHFVDTGQRPQNFIRDTGMNERFQEYPKLNELIRLKDEQIRKGATPPMYLKCDLSSFDLCSLDSKFDVILIDPPLEEYQRKTSGIAYSWQPWDFEEIMNLKIENISAHRSFVFLWCGSCEGLDLGRECLKKWGFRRCEDICWVKTNTSDPGNTTHLEPKSTFQHTKEHCLMGIKGTVRRNQDGHFIHANIDLDIIITEELKYNIKVLRCDDDIVVFVGPSLKETQSNVCYCLIPLFVGLVCLWFKAKPELGNTDKPEEIFHIIEHFCLGRRRLHLFGNDATVRPGWLTLGPALSSSNFHKETYSGFFQGENDFLLKHSEEIEVLRPKTPPPKGRGAGRGGGNANVGMGRGLGRGGFT